VSDASVFVALLNGKIISHVWRGYGSAIFIEFGALTPGPQRNGKPTQPSGELTLMIEWSWRVERPRSILGGSWSSERRWPHMLRRLLGSRVAAVEFFGHLPEISLSLSNGLRVVSFMTAESQPSWAVIARAPSIGSLCVRRGLLHVEPPSRQEGAGPRLPCSMDSAR